MFNWLITKIGLAVVLFSLCANAAYAQINVFACEPEWAALTQQLGGTAVKVFSATTSQQDPHHIQARPSLIARVRRADLLVCTGADLEVGWLPLLLRKSGNGKILPGQRGHFMAADQVALLEKPAVLDRSLGDIHAAGNPHIHFDPRRMQKIASALSQRLIIIDPANSALYQQNQQDFTQQWQQALKKWQQTAKALHGTKIVVSHNSWVYLEQWLGLIKVATLEPKPGIPPSSAHLSTVLTQLKRNPAAMILTASYQNNQAARWLEKKTAIPSIELAFGPAKNETLVQWFEQIVELLVKVRA
ncbi:MAG: zinc ABC transporter substrate-binding protein [Pseudomonadales bacterium]|nr:zinc ABC transporter substrate-binding protein [Pseudomonadales bacterium]